MHKQRLIYYLGCRGNRFNAEKRKFKALGEINMICIILKNIEDKSVKIKSEIEELRQTIQQDMMRHSQEEAMADIAADGEEEALKTKSPPIEMKEQLLLKEKESPLPTEDSVFTEIYQSYEDLTQSNMTL